MLSFRLLSAMLELQMVCFSVLITAPAPHFGSVNKSEMRVWFIIYLTIKGVMKLS